MNRQQQYDSLPKPLIDVLNLGANNGWFTTYTVVSYNVLLKNSRHPLELDTLYAIRLNWNLYKDIPIVNPIVNLPGISGRAPTDLEKMVYEIPRNSDFREAVLAGPEHIPRYAIYNEFQRFARPWFNVYPFCHSRLENDKVYISVPLYAHHFQKDIETHGGTLLDRKDALLVVFPLAKGEEYAKDKEDAKVEQTNQLRLDITLLMANKQPDMEKLVFMHGLAGFCYESKALIADCTAVIRMNCLNNLGRIIVDKKTPQLNLSLILHFLKHIK